MQGSRTGGNPRAEDAQRDVPTEVVTEAHAETLS